MSSWAICGVCGIGDVISRVVEEARVDETSTSDVGDSAGESGKGVEDGDDERGLAAFAGTGEALAEISGVVATDTSPIANVARNLSSRLDLGIFVSGELGLLGNETAGLGLPERCMARDFRKLDNADSAS